MTKISAIAWVTIRQAIRQKLAVNLLLFALGLLAASLTISSLTFGEQYRIIVDLGLSAMEIFGTLIATFLGAGLIAGDVERRAVYPIITKAVSRWQYVVGRYLGLAAVTTLNLLLMSLAFCAVLGIASGGLAFLWDSPFLTVLAALAVQFCMVGAIATLFSAFSTSTLSAIFTLGFVVAGHLASDLLRFWSTKGPWADRLGGALYALVPNLEALNLREAMVYRDPVPAAFAATGLGYGLLYAGGVLALSAAIFTRRDLK